MNYPHKLLLLIMSLCFTSSLAQEPESETIASVELLEFLGEWETEDGDWIDPLELDDEEMAKLLDESHQQGQDNE